MKAGARPPFPPMLHVHAVLMGSFLLLLLAQTVLMATGRKRAAHAARHGRDGAGRRRWSWSGFILAPTMYHQVWGGAHFRAAAGSCSAGAGACRSREYPAAANGRGNPVRAVHHDRAAARAANAGLHKRMMFLATAVPLRRGDRPDGLAADDDAGEPVWRRISMCCWRWRRCSCGT